MVQHCSYYIIVEKCRYDCSDQRYSINNILNIIRGKLDSKKRRPSSLNGWATLVLILNLRKKRRNKLWK